jgi:NAD(P)-dependent dehydrogenase (short-subunit alcohol dehydrogenase family)
MRPRTRSGIRDAGREASVVSVARVWVTGSADGIGQAAAAAMVADGHDVVLHARSEARARQASAAVPGAIGAIAGDLGSLEEIRAAAEAAAGYGPFDAVIHNAGIMMDDVSPRPGTVDGLEETFAVNVVAPYLLTALMPPAGRLVYLSSGMHLSGRPTDDWQWERRPYRGTQAYSDSKLAVTALAFAVAARRPDTLSNAVDPGWVRTRMGGAGAPVSLEKGAAKPVRLATGTDDAVLVSGKYFSHGVPHSAHRLASDEAFQDTVLSVCQKITGTALG